MTSIFALIPLLLSIALVQLGSSALGPLDALSGLAYGFSPRQIGLLGSAHFAGFFLGCLIAPWMISRAGHSRAFAALAAVGVISVLCHVLTNDPLAWMAMRVGAGLSVAGAYTAVESWVQARTDNASRGRVLSVYRIVDSAGAVFSQLLIIQLTPGAYVSYVVLAIIGAISLMPMSLTTASPPKTLGRPRLRPWRAILLSPLGAAGAVAVGLTSSSFRMVGPIYGAELALTPAEIGLFLASGLVGGAVAQPVVGYAADRFDRRWVLILVSVAAGIVCLGLSTGWARADGVTLAIGAFLFGAAAFPLYSVSAAHANDYCPPDFVVELNAALLLLFAVGAIVSPLVAAELITRFGPDALWLYIGAAHASLIAFGFYRMTRRPSAAARRPYRWLPRSSLLLGRLLKRGAEDAPKDQP